jgi:DNA-binding transcriptional MocR family regulator
MKLLQLAEAYGFIIFEDDYDYDFHYLSKPLLALWPVPTVQVWCCTAARLPKPFRLLFA